MVNGDLSKVELNQVPYVISSLNNIRNRMISIGNVDQAEKADYLVVELRTSKISKSKTQTTQKKIDSISQRYELAKKEHEELDLRLKTTLNGINEYNFKQLTQLKEKHQKEVDNFLNLWEKPNKRRKYSHFSTELNNLVTKSELLLLTRRYEDHRKMKEIIDNKMQLETEIMSKAMKDEYDLQYSILMDKQIKELEHLSISHKNKIDTFNVTAQNQLEISLLKVQKLENQLNQLKKNNEYWSKQFQPPLLPFGRLTTSQRNSRYNNSARSISSLTLPNLSPPKSLNRKHQTFTLN